MKKYRNVFFILFILLITASIGSAQDLIVLRNGDEIQVKVLEIKQTEVSYKNWTNIDGPTYTKSKADIFMIKYPNGSKDVFNITSNNSSVYNMDVDVIKVASNYFKRVFIDRSNGVVSPVFDFKKTNGVQKEYFRQKIYEIEYEVKISLLKDGCSRVPDGIIDAQECFAIYDKKPDSDWFGDYERDYVKYKKGQSMILKGE
jgi:hypothetical protein